MKIFKITIPLPNLPPDIYLINDCISEEDARKIGTKIFNDKRGKHLAYPISLPPMTDVREITSWSDEKQKMVDIFHFIERNVKATEVINEDIKNNFLSPEKFREKHITPYI